MSSPRSSSVITRIIEAEDEPQRTPVAQSLGVRELTQLEKVDPVRGVAIRAGRAALADLDRPPVGVGDSVLPNVCCPVQPDDLPRGRRLAQRQDVARAACASKSS
jgi:hypothetical protein